MPSLAKGQSKNDYGHQGSSVYNIVLFIIEYGAQSYLVKISTFLAKSVLLISNLDTFMEILEEE